MQGLIRVNGVEIPYPARGLDIMVATIVDSARNANGAVVGQKIGRDQYKLNALQWLWLTAEEWARILSLFSGFYVMVEFPDPVSNSWRTLKMYPGDRSAEPYWLDDVTGLPTHYRNCKVNLIDVGEA